MRTLLWRACALSMLVACGGSGNVTIDGGGDSGGADATPSEGGADAAPSDGAPADASDAATFGGRMFVSQESAGLDVWDGSDGIAADVAPTFTMTDSSVTAGTRAAIVVANRLIVGQGGGGLAAFDAAKTLGAAATPSALVPVTAFIKPSALNSLPIVTLLTYNEKTNILWASGQWGTDRFDSGATLSSASTAGALFSHSYYQLPGFAYDPNGDRALLGQISGAGVLAWDGAKSATGSPASSFTLDQSLAAWSMAIAQDRLYAIGGDTSNGTTPRESIDVWNAISGVSSAKSPDFAITSGIAANDYSPYVTVAANMLIACIQSGKVLIWKNASSITGDKAPDVTLTTQLNQPQKVVYGYVTNRLYVLDADGVAIYANATTTPTFVAKVTSGISKPHDLVVLE
jgi:hypothetical protein